MYSLNDRFLNLIQRNTLEDKSFVILYKPPGMQLLGLLWRVFISTYMSVMFSISASDCSMGKALILRS